VLLENSIETLRAFSLRLFQAYNDEAALVAELNALTDESKSELWNRYQNATGPVRGVRRGVITILRERSISIAELGDIIRTAVAANETAFVRMYRTWYNILYPLVLQNDRAAMNEAIANIQRLILEDLGSSDQLKHVKFDFSGERETGSTRTWIAFFNAAHKKQDTAKQLFIDIQQGAIAFSLYDRPEDALHDQVAIADGQPFSGEQMLEIFHRNLPAILADRNGVKPPRQIDLIHGQRLFKISMGTGIDDETVDECLNAGVVMVHEDTAPKGRSHEPQGERFTDTMQVGDYFYLCRGNQRFVTLGRVTTPATPSFLDAWANDGWMQRSFSAVQEPTRDDRYEGPSKWWSPKNRSTCIEITERDLEEANDVIFRPYFSTIFTRASVNPIPANMNVTPASASPNTIFYGPPGTGKTYRMQRIIDELNLVEEGEAAQPSFSTFVADYYWWELLAMALLDKQQATVPELLDHPLIQAKLAISSIKHPPQRLWSTLQHRTVLGCPHVKLREEKRHGNLVFYKEANSVWRLDDAVEFKQQFPLLLTAWQDFKDGNRQGGTKAKHYTFTTCHQSLSYEDFIEGIKPVLHDGVDEEEGSRQVAYEIRKGVFYQACEQASQRAGFISLKDALERSKEERAEKFKAAIEAGDIHVLFLDEINRANVSATFGELITLIEKSKRLGGDDEIADAKLPYSQSLFGVPANLYIIGTMNTADRSVEALDAALRRRFAFEEMMPDYDTLKDDSGASSMVADIDLATLLQTINARITWLKDRDHQIGHTFLMSVRTADELRAAFKTSIVPLLQEYFFNDLGGIQSVLGSGFVRTQQQPPFPRGVPPTVTGSDQMLELVPMDDGFDIIAALRQTLNLSTNGAE